MNNVTKILTVKEFFNSSTPKIVKFLIAKIGIEEFTKLCELAIRNNTESETIRQARLIEAAIYYRVYDFLNDN